MKHIKPIKASLGIAGIFTQVSSFYKKGNADDQGAQIDLVLDRSDHTINLFEIKFHDKPFLISKEYAERLRKKNWVFQDSTGTRKGVHWVFVAAFGLTPNQYSSGLVLRSLSLDDLF